MDLYVLFISLYFLLYMFRVLFTPILRSTVKFGLDRAKSVKVSQSVPAPMDQHTAKITHT
jgi:hypothetical protein